MANTVFASDSQSSFVKRALANSTAVKITHRIFIHWKLSLIAGRLIVPDFMGSMEGRSSTTIHFRQWVILELNLSAW
jgi:hypothetical protein